MEHDFSLMPRDMHLLASTEDLDACNDLSSPFGLTLTGAHLLRLTERRFQALEATGRIEFGQGVLKKLVSAFCDSPHMMQHTYEETLGALQDIFYYFKNQSGDILSDDELIEAMRSVFNGKAQGSLDYLAGTALEHLCRTLRGMADEAMPQEADYEP